MFVFVIFGYNWGYWQTEVFTHLVSFDLDSSVAQQWFALTNIANSMQGVKIKMDIKNTFSNYIIKQNVSVSFYWSNKLNGYNVFFHSDYSKSK